MSGPMTPALADAASAHARYARDLAQAEKEGISIGRLIARNARANLAKRTEDEARKAESLPGRTWRRMDLRTRSVLVMLGSTHVGDPSVYAAQAWEALAPADQVGIAACARTLGRDLRRASCLF